jgi:hypothetical protein
MQSQHIFIKINIRVTEEQFPFYVLILVDDALTGIYNLKSS